MKNIWVIMLVRMLIASIIIEIIRPYSFLIPRPAGSNFHLQQSLFELQGLTKSERTALIRGKFTNMFLYFISFVLAYVAIFLPLVIKSFKEHRMVFLDEGKHLGGFLPHMSIYDEKYMLGVVIAVIIVSVLLVCLSRLFTMLIAKALNYFVDVKIAVVNLIEFTFYIIFSLIISGYVISEFYSYKAKHAFIIPFIVVFVILIMFTAKKKTKE